MTPYTLRVGSRYGAVFDTQVPDGFSLDSFVQDVRSKGYYFNGSVYVPHDTIAFIALVPPGVESHLPNQEAWPPSQTRQ
jgi:hypothetical protein